jgi:hypothetical protein
MTETLLGVNPPSSKDPADSPSAEELAAAKELVRQARAQGGRVDRSGRVVESTDQGGAGDRLGGGDGGASGL